MQPPRALAARGGFLIKRGRPGLFGFPAGLGVQLAAAKRCHDDRNSVLENCLYKKWVLFGERDNL
jgi:hypothetical protein